MVNRVHSSAEETICLFGGLRDGAMFRYPQSVSEENIYMKLATSPPWEPRKAVLLKTGVIYEISGDKRIYPVPANETVHIKAV